MPSLSIPDSREAKFDLVEELAYEGHRLPPVYITTHARARVMNTLKVLPALRSRVTLVVAEPEVIEYRAAHPDVDILPIPAGWGGSEIGHGRAKMFTLRHARSIGQKRIMLIDDDLVGISLLYTLPNGKASHAMPPADERELFRWGVVVLFAKIMEEAFAAEPTLVLGAPQCSNPSRTKRSASIRWALNFGRPPSQMVVWDVERFFRYLPEGIDLERFNRHGDDIGGIMQILQAGGSGAWVGSILAHWFDYETRSVIRTPETAPALRQDEHDALMELEWARFIKTNTDILDRPQWHAPDWTALKKDGRVKERTVFWPDEDALDLI